MTESLSQSAHAQPRVMPGEVLGGSSRGLSSSQPVATAAERYSPSAEPAAELLNVSFSYTKDAFIEGLSAVFPHGAVTSIVGPNGCGKSTVVKLIDGILRPSAGEAHVEGVRTLALHAKERARRVAVLAQAGRPPAMTVEALVACGRHPHLERFGRLTRDDREQVEYALERTGIARFRASDLRRLSGGERQRAFIAMTLAQDTRLIVLDEPTTYLDIRACHEVMQLVRTLNEKEGKTVVMVIHDLDLALRYSDRLLVMERGRAVAAGTVEEVLAAGAVEHAFGVSIHPHETAAGRAYTLFPG
ncbi:MAG: ABC transporter ATP-binding protein [Gordonibacter sp.]|uniref:ABC transporter ATP-binding protein n=1 Tax=Gordonibacter sp. TaxID=1968902 RepID=UPI002FC6AC69